MHLGRGAARRFSGIHRTTTGAAGRPQTFDLRELTRAIKRMARFGEDYIAGNAPVEQVHEAFRAAETAWKRA